MMDDPILLARLLGGSRAMGVALDEDAARTMLAYLARVLDANQTLNLTRITDPMAAVEGHLLDSLALLGTPGVLPQDVRDLSFADLGSGAGFPGVPLAVARPDFRGFFFDSVRKKMDFVRETCASLRIPAECAHGRAEDFGASSDHRGLYDLVVARAVAHAANLCEWALPLAKVGGSAVFYKGPGIAEELEAARGACEELGGAPPRVIPANLPGAETAHNFVVVVKVRETPSRFPRNPAQARRSPWT